MLPKIATPKYDMIVPSTGKQITYRPYLIKEEKILLIALESQDEKQIEKAVSSIIIECIEEDINIQELTTFDIELIFVTLRSKSVGEGIKLNPKCSECDESTEIKIDLERVEVKNNTDKELRVKINDEMTIDLHWPKIKDKLTDKDKETEADSIINLISKSIDTIYFGEEIHSTKDVPQSEVKDFVESLSTDQFKTVLELMKNMPYVSYDMKFICKSCKHENEKELKGLVDFFT
jgi:hypothetical protein